LIRAIFISETNERLASGPGLLTKTFGIDLSFNNLKVTDNNFLWITERKSNIRQNDLIQTTRIGINKAKNIKWRWYLKNSRSVSKRIKGDVPPKLKNSKNHLSLKS
jgi:DNA-3-methyladenine glycosylase